MDKKDICGIALTCSFDFRKWNLSTIYDPHNTGK